MHWLTSASELLEWEPRGAARIEIERTELPRERADDPTGPAIQGIG
jgi:hypothetical protein